MCLIIVATYHYQSIANDTSYFNNSPIAASTDLPISIGSGLPKTLSANLPAPSEAVITISGIIKSNANDSGTDNEVLTLDGESHSLELGVEYGLSEKWSMDFQLAYIRHTGGSLDGLIDSWHNAFGLSDGDRPLFDENDLNFTYQNNDEQQQINQSVGGISDLRLGVGYSLVTKYASIDSLIIRSGLNLPTGDPEKLTGSNKLDWDIGLYMNGRSSKWSKLSWHANLGYLYIGDDRLFGIETKQNAWFNSLGLSWAANPKLQFKMQLDSHSALFDSEIDEIAEFASQLTLGTTYHSQSFGLLELYFSEDLTVNRAADFSVGLSVKFAL